MKTLFYLLITIQTILFSFATILFAEDSDKAVTLSLEKVIKDVATHNPAIAEARLQWLISEKNIQAAWGEYEPDLVVGTSKDRLVRENSTTQSISQGFNQTFSESKKGYRAALEGTLLTGTSYQAGYSVSQLRNSLQTSKEYESFLGVSGTQPLLKNAWGSEPKTRIKISKVEEEIAFHNYRKQMMNTIIEAEMAYWNLALTQDFYQIATDSVEIAKSLLKDAQERIKVGKFSEIEFKEAETELELRLSNQTDSYQKMKDASTELKILLANSDTTYKNTLKTSELLTSLTPRYRNDTEGVNDTSMNSALDMQPDYLIRLNELDKENIRLSFFKNQRLPELNLNGSIGFNGLDESSGNAWQKIQTNDYPSWSVEFEIRVPIFSGITEKSELETARLNKQIAVKRLDAIKYEITRSIDNLIDGMNSYAIQVLSARKLVDNRKEILDAEIERLAAGKSNMRLVFELENDLFEARRQELESIIRYKESAMRLNYIRGTVLTEVNMEIFDKERLSHQNFESSQSKSIN